MRLVNPAAAKVIDRELAMALTWLTGTPTQTRVELARGRIEMAISVLARLSQDEYSTSDISEAA